ncbi:UV-damage endonuclease [Pseudocyphellaria aurata]|nr:UV-damage endonuclease [Pseudocyphellaria aurata]
MAKRKAHSSLARDRPPSTIPISVALSDNSLLPEPGASPRKVSQLKPEPPATNPDRNPSILDGPEAIRASPDAKELEVCNREKLGMGGEGDVKEDGDNDDSDSPLSDLSDTQSPIKAGKSKSKQNRRVQKQSGIADSRIDEPAVQATTIKQKPAKDYQFLDPEADGDEEAGEGELQAALSRPPPVNSNYLPLPWKGRLGYACLCTYLRYSNPPVFSSRTCRIASILENRHPLKDPNKPPHQTKNRPDKEQPASIERGQAFVETLGLANARDIVKMLRWNDRYGIKFLRLSSEMFPFASHEEYGYKLAPFASEALAEAGRVAAELGHRLTTHPGQFTQLGSPRKQVIDSAIRDLEYHAELLSLLNMPPQQDRDAVMILHLGGVFGDKTATLDRFRENYKGLSQGIKNRIVLENDDVSWSVHDLLPLCEELNIPMVLDYHHHNINFDADQIREGTNDIVELYPRILATWKKKNITPKMHYSEPTPAAITAMQRRKHSPRVATLPPCPPTMDLMIEAKDKEQAVFELMRAFKLPGYDRFNDIIPHIRKDENKPMKTPKKKATRKSTKKSKAQLESAEIPEEATDTADKPAQVEIADDEVGMGGPEGRVYWPPGMEHWLRPVKRVVQQKDSSTHEDKKAVTPAKKRKATADATEVATKLEEEVEQDNVSHVARKRVNLTPKASAKSARTSKKTARIVPTPSSSDEKLSDPLSDLSIEQTSAPKKLQAPSRRSARTKKISYTEDLE